jgi:Metal-dependent amidase/aminoacylase/carboxypeptidase
VVEGTARLYGAKAKLTYRRGYPVLKNHEQQTAFAASIASEIVGADRVDTDFPPVMGAEDFSYMLGGTRWRVHFCRQRRQRRPASPRLQLQRRRDPSWDVLLGASGRDGNGGLIAL